MTTPTQCQCSQQLRGQCVSVVKDYVDYGHPVSKVNDYTVLLLTKQTHAEIVIDYAGHNVGVVVDYADTVSAESSNTWTRCWHSF